MEPVRVPCAMCRWKNNKKNWTKKKWTDRSIEKQKYRYLLVKKQDGRTCLRSAVLVYAKTSNLCDAGFCNYFDASSQVQQLSMWIKFFFAPVFFWRYVFPIQPAPPPLWSRGCRAPCECTNVCSAHRGCTLAKWHVSPSCAGFKWAAGDDIWRTKLKWSLIIWSASQHARCP